MRVFLTALFAASLVAPNSTFAADSLEGSTVAKILQKPDTYIDGYVRATIDSNFSVFGSAEDRVKKFVSECLVSSSLSSGQMISVAKKVATDKPNLLPMPAFMLVYETLTAICGEPPKRPQ